MPKSPRRFFWLSEDEALRCVLYLANYTGWSLAEISDLDVDELVRWVTTIPKPKTR